MSMANGTRRKLIVGNWKMHGSHAANAELLAGMAGHVACGFTSFTRVASIIPLPINDWHS